MFIQKNKNIFSKILILLIILVNLVYCDPPNWDENGDGVLDNYNDYENNGSITAKVYADEQDFSELGDMIAAFVLGEQRGVGLASEVPPFLGEGIAYLTMLLALLTGPVSLISAVSGARPIFIFLIYCLLSISPVHIKEDFNKGAVLLKAISAIFVSIGVIALGIT